MNKNNYKKQISFITVFIFVLAVSFVFSITAYAEENYFDFAGGNGTEENPYKISTPAHLNNIRNYLDAFYIQTSDIDLEAATAEGGAFYDSGSGWQPIGDNSVQFTGSYDGCGHRLTGLKITRNTPYAGLFGYNSGVIKNLGMEGASVSLEISSSPSVFAGGIAGYNRGTISGCYNTCSISVTVAASSSNTSAYAGGITGYNASGTISSCYNTGSVSATATCYYSSYVAASPGGITGINKGTISSCYNTGSISATVSSADVYAFGKAHAYAGGIAGYSGVTIRDCYNTGGVSSEVSSSYASAYAYSGGISGYSPGYDGDGTIISGCYNTGSVSSFSFSSFSSSSSGGIVGRIEFGTISNCYTIYELHYNALGTELTIEQMKVQASYEGFDFDVIWRIDPYINNGYPILKNIVYEKPEIEYNSLDCAITGYMYTDNTHTFNVVLTNNATHYITISVFVALYDEDGLIGIRKYNVNKLDVGAIDTIPVTINTTKKATILKAICMDISTLQPVKTILKKVL